MSVPAVAILATKCAIQYPRRPNLNHGSKHNNLPCVKRMATFKKEYNTMINFRIINFDADSMKWLVIPFGCHVCFN